MTTNKLPAQSPKELADAYGKVVASFGLGLQRFWGAEAAAARLIVALLEFRQAPGELVEDHPHIEALRSLEKVAYSSYDALSYVMGISHLVYATTILDTFLTDTTQFLLLIHPKAMGSQRQVALGSVLDAETVEDLVTDAAVKRAREVAYLPFAGRLEFLTKTFGLVIDLPIDVAQAIEHYPSIRNTAVHDQGMFDIRLGQGGSISLRQKTSARYPTQVTGDDVHGAATAYSAVARLVASAVFHQTLKVSSHPSLDRLNSVESDTDD